MGIQLIAQCKQSRLSNLRLGAKQPLFLLARLLPLLNAEIQTAPHEENETRPRPNCNQSVPGHMIEILQNEPGCAGYGNGCDHGRRGCFQFKSDPGLRLSQQPTAKRAQGKTSQEHEDDRHRLFIDRLTLSQEIMNGFQKVEKIKAAPSNDLDLPEGPSNSGHSLDS